MWMQSQNHAGTSAHIKYAELLQVLHIETIRDRERRATAVIVIPAQVRFPQ